MSRLQTQYSWRITIPPGSLPGTAWRVFRMLNGLRDRGFSWEHLPHQRGAGGRITVRHRSASAGTLLRLSVPPDVSPYITIEDPPCIHGL